MSMTNYGNDGELIIHPLDNFKRYRRAYQHGVISRKEMILLWVTEPLDWPYHFNRWFRKRMMRL